MLKTIYWRGIALCGWRQKRAYSPRDCRLESDPLVWSQARLRLVIIWTLNSRNEEVIKKPVALSIIKSSADKRKSALILLWWLQHRDDNTKITNIMRVNKLGTSASSQACKLFSRLLFKGIWIFMKLIKIWQL